MNFQTVLPSSANARSYKKNNSYYWKLYVMLGAVPGPLHKVSYLILWEVNTSTIPILQMKLCLRGKTPFPKSHCLGNGGRVI